MFIVLQLYTFVVGNGNAPLSLPWKGNVLTSTPTDHHFGISPFFLLKRLDLNQRSYLSNRVFTTILFCPHQSNANVQFFLRWYSSCIVTEVGFEPTQAFLACSAYETDMLATTLLRDIKTYELHRHSLSNYFLHCL